MGKKFFLALAIFCLGAGGGIWAQAFLLPYLASHQPFQQWQFVKDWSEKTIVVHPVQEFIITESEAIPKAVAKTEEIVVAIQSKKGKSVIEGSGFLVASDGMIATLASLVPEGYEIRVFLSEHGGAILDAQVVKRDVKNNLALLTIAKSNLQTAGFGETGNIQEGMPIFLVGKIFEEKQVITMVNQGVVKAFGKYSIRTNIFEKAILEGSPLFNIRGELIGINTIDKEGKVTALPVSLLRPFLGL